MALQIPFPWNESARIARLGNLRALKKGDEVLERLTRIAAAATGLPVALVTLVEQDTQRCVAQCGGTPLDTIPRQMAFCAHAILKPGRPLVVPDARRDARFADSPLVTGPMGVRYYAGVPLALPGDGFAVGALCVVDTKPHEDGAVDVQTLRLLGQEIARHLAAARGASGALVRARELLSGLAIGAVVLEGDELSINAALSAMTGYGSQELRTLDLWFQTLFGKGAELERKRYETARARNFRTVSYCAIRRKDGEERTFEVSRSSVDGAEVWILNDITVAKDAQEAMMSARDAAEEAARVKSAFLETMSHELRTPMNGVFGMTDALLHTELTPAQREYAEMVRAQSEALIRVLDDVLDYSELEAQRVLIRHEPFSPRAVVEDACHELVALAAAKQLSFVVDAAGLSEAAVGDAARLRQALGSVVSNALKFTEKGGVVVKACTEPCADGNLLLRITVGDTGIGIPDDVRGALFTPFVQGDSSTTRRFGGLGLGLAVTRAIVFLMGGELTFESEVGRGTTVTLSIVLSEGPRMPAQWERRLSGRRANLVGEGAAMDAVLASLQAFGADVVRGDTVSVPAAPCDVWFVAEDALGGQVFRDAAKLPPIVVVQRTGHAREGSSRALVLATPHRQHDVLVAVQGALEGARAGGRRTGTPHGVEGGHALVVDDNPVNVKVAVAMLGRLGWSADVAVDGQEALLLMGAHRYDVVLMDCQMPVMDGYEATKQLRTKEGVNRTFVVALTANALTADRERCAESGMDDFLSKPLRPQELSRVLQRAVAKRA